MAIPLNLSEVPNIAPYIQYVAGSGQTVYPYPFPITQDSDLVVVINGVTQATDSTYTLSGQGNDTGGNVTLNSGSTAGDIVTLYRDVPIERVTQIGQNSGFSSAAFNAEFNTLYLIAQQLETSVNQCLQIPNTNNPAPATVLTKANYANKYLSFDSNGNPIPAVLTSSGSVTGALVASLLNAIPGVLSSLTTSVAKNAAETASAVVVANPSVLNSPYYDMTRYGIVPNGADNTAIVQAVFNMAKVYGGTLVFPYGDWAFYLDVSGTNMPVTIDGQGSTFRPYTSTPTKSAIVFADNSGAGFSGTNVIWRHCNFTARVYGSSTAGDLNYAVYHKYASSVFHDCFFQYGKIASFYGLYAQYTEFYSCVFSLSQSGAVSAGCLLDSHTFAASSNEVLFERCYFFLNSTGIWLKGTGGVRIKNCTLQGQSGTTSNGCASILLDQDSTSSFAADTVVDNCWFEDNTGYHIYEAAAIKTRLVNNNTFASGGQNLITFTHCYDVVVTGHDDFDSTITFAINHPSGSSDNASLTWHGNNINPTVAIAHSGTQHLDVAISGSFTATLNGATTAPTGTVNYSINGDLTTLTLPANLLASINTASPTISGAPGLLTPKISAVVPAIVENNSTVGMGAFSVSGAGLMTLYSTVALGTFNAGPGGIMAQTLPSYRLNS